MPLNGILSAFYCALSTALAANVANAMTVMRRATAQHDTFVLAIFLFLPLAGCAAAIDPTISVSIQPGASHVLAITGLSSQTLAAFDNLDPARKQDVLRVRVADAPAGAPPVLGQVTRRDTELFFTPRYPLQPGITYRTRIDLAPLNISAGPKELTVSIPSSSADAITRVVEIYPSSDALPENLLKFYIHFSGAMSLGEAYRHVYLLDEKNQPVAQPFLELDEELWNSTMTRFTLFFDPGRIKHGLVSQMQLGAALQAGHTYQLVIDAEFHDAHGRAMGQAASKTFRALPAERRQPDPARWRIVPPHGRSTDALTVVFDEPLDHAMLQRVLTLHEPNGKLIPGKIHISDHERQWTFTPTSPWQSGQYTLAVESILEDVAGNNIQRPFEVDTHQPPPLRQSDVINLPVNIR
jgi:hypothetical protein